MKKLCLLLLFSNTVIFAKKSDVQQSLKKVNQTSAAAATSVEKLEELFVHKLENLIQEDITQAIKDELSKEEHPLMTFGKKLLEQDIISVISKQAVELLGALEEQLKAEEKIAKEQGNKKQAKLISKKRKQIIEAKHFLSLANKYLNKEIEQITDLLEKAMKKVNTNLEGAEKIITEIVGAREQKSSK